METIDVYSSFSHSFGGKSKDIVYEESKYIKLPNGQTMCIDSVDKKIGEILDSEYDIKLWGNKEPWVERIEQDFINLQCERQIIKFCSKDPLILERKNFKLVPK